MTWYWYVITAGISIVIIYLLTRTTTPILLKYKCNSNYQCVEDPNGPYNSIPECQMDCIQPTHKECNVNNKCVVVQGIGDDKCTSDYQCDDLYYVNTSILIFGNFNRVNEQITEFKQFIETNSKLRLNLTINYYPKLQDSEICSGGPNCYFVAPNCLLSATKEKIPLHQMSNVILYEVDYNLKPQCYAGGCYCGHSINGVPFIAIPKLSFSNDPLGPWNQIASQILVHEWMHSLDWTFDYLQYPDFPNLDGVCEQLGYNPDNDPGWAKCYKYFLTLITQPMYYDLEKYNKTLSWLQIPEQDVNIVEI